jgi:putative membrane protein
MLVSGCLLTFALVGSDPMPGRGRPATRLGTLFVALAAHDILAKYLYVHAADLAAAQPGSGSTASWRLGAQWLWYGGDLLDVLITVILCARWYSAAGRELRRQVRRSHLPTGSDLESG